MAENFGLVSKSLRPKLGRRSYLTPEGKVALMFLKMYTGLSCPKLKIQQLQDILAEQWKPYMQNLDMMYTDATCYESEMRYLTDPKLLWEGIEKSYETMCELSKRLGIHRPRTKFIDVQKANLTYRKQRRHSKSQTRKMTRRLLELLGKILKEIRKTERAYENAQSLLTTREKSDLKIITKMYRQQKNHFQSKDCRESIPNRIVSISKPYVRPIVRGKEVKSVEFGAKVNNILVDGISFIEKLSFNAFNEGTRLIHCLKMHKRLFGVEAKKVGGDTGYAGTDNRDYCKENGKKITDVKDRQWCDEINGNIVLIPKHVYDILGTNDPYFRHAAGDTDYGLRAKEAGVGCFIGKGIFGECDLHERPTVWMDPSQPFKKRWKNFFSPLGNNPYEFFYFKKKHKGLVAACITFCFMWIHFFFPWFWQNATSENE